jgi:hypothetical protein
MTRKEMVLETSVSTPFKSLEQLLDQKNCIEFSRVKARPGALPSTYPHHFYFVAILTLCAVQTEQLTDELSFNSALKKRPRLLALTC